MSTQESVEAAVESADGISDGGETWQTKLASVAIAAYEADPPEWLVALVLGWHNSTCVGMGRVRDNGICLDAPESVRRAAGLA